MKRSTSTAVYAGARLSSGPEGIIYNSTRSRQQHEADGYTARCGIVIPNGFDTNKWRPNHIAAARLRHHLGLKDSVKIVGYVARAHTQKDLPNLFEAFSRVAEHDEDSHLVCIGRGLAEAAPQKLPSGRVSFMGERHDLADIMPGFTFLCLSSEVEGFPNVIGEAMACAVPCISTDVGDAAAIVAETGFVVPPRNANALAEALLRGLTMSEAERTTAGQAARQRIISHYSLPSVIEQYRNFYVTLLGIQ